MKIQSNRPNTKELLRFYYLEVIVLLLGISHQISQKIFHVSMLFIDSYLDDLLAVPFFSTLILLIENTIVYKVHYRKHSLFQLFSIFITITVLFEFIFPSMGNYTFDYWDILCYFLGFIIYFLAIKKAP